MILRFFFEKNKKKNENSFETFFVFYEKFFEKKSYFLKIVQILFSNRN